MRSRWSTWAFSRLPGPAALTGVLLAALAVFGIEGAGEIAAQDCDALNIDAVAVERCVVPGHQAEIDAGHVVRVDDLSTSDGHWLAGHRSTHGSTFGALTQLEIGDHLEYRGRVYEIVEYTTARFNAPGHVLEWTRRGLPTVVLQTSVDSTSAHLWRAEAVATDDGVVSAHVAAMLASLTRGASIVRH